MTARFSGQQRAELHSRDLTSFLILTRVDTDQVQRRFIPDCGTILCQLQKTWSYQGLLYLKKKKGLLISTALQHGWRWACCPHRRALSARLSHGCRNHHGHHLSGTRGGKLRCGHLTTSHIRSLLSSITPWQTVRLWGGKVQAALPETSSPRGKLKESFVFYSCLQVD